MPRPRAPARMPLVSRCTTAPVTRTAPMPIPPTAPATASTLALIGDSAGGTSTTHTCTCNDGYFGDGDTAGTGCTTCTAVANSINVTCPSATNSCAACVTGSILVPAATTSTADCFEKSSGIILWCWFSFRLWCRSLLRLGLS